MRVLMLSKALVVGAYQRKAEELARLPDLELLVVVPPSWIQEGAPLTLERHFSAGYELAVEPIVLNGHFHLHAYPFLRRRIAAFRPDLIHIDEEAYNLAAFQAQVLAGRRHVPTVYFTWQNLDRPYPPPFSLMERYVLARASHCIAGNEDAANIQRARGFRRDISVIPQFGIDPTLFSPGDEPAGRFTVGYAGRLVEQKGLRVLLAAFEQLPSDCHLLLAGSGPLEATIREQARQRGWADRLIVRTVASTDMPEVYNQLHCLALPSLTTLSWKEQFGRAAVEAMACGVPVVGSDSGEIPRVIDEAGLIVPEGDAAALAAALLRLYRDPALRQQLGRAARAHVLARYTHEQIAKQTHTVYTKVLHGSNPAGAR